MMQNAFTELIKVFLPDEVILAGSDILKAEAEHQNIIIVDTSVRHNAYTLLRNGNM